jgi:hypothetical protein
MHHLKPNRNHQVGLGTIPLGTIPLAPDQECQVPVPGRRGSHLAQMWHAESKTLPTQQSPSLLTWAAGSWGYVDLNHGPLPYQGAGPQH